MLLVERRDPASAGARWINGVPPWCFDEAGLERPQAPERWGGAQPPAFVLRAAGHEPRMRIASPVPWHVDMRHLVERLRARALAAGARAARGVVTGIGFDRGRAHRVEIEGIGTIAPRLVVDASGMRGAVRRHAGRAAWPEVRWEDTCAAAQFTFAVRDARALERYLVAHGAAPGESLGIVGVAGGFSTLTLFTEPAMREVGVLTGSIPALGAPSGAGLLRRFTERASWLGDRLFGGQGAIPLRRPYRTLGAGGVALVGDAACQVYASHGSGVGLALVAARMLADCCASAADPGSPEVLDAYGRAFHARFGAMLAGADAMRRFSQGLEPHQIAALIESGLFGPRLFGAGLAQRMPALDRALVLDTARGAARGPRAFARVLPALGRVVALSALGRGAPRGRAARIHDRMVAILIGGSPDRSSASVRVCVPDPGSAPGLVL